MLPPAPCSLIFPLCYPRQTPRPYGPPMSIVDLLSHCPLVVFQCRVWIFNDIEAICLLTLASELFSLPLDLRRPPSLPTPYLRRALIPRRVMIRFLFAKATEQASLIFLPFISQLPPSRPFPFMLSQPYASLGVLALSRFLEVDIFPLRPVFFPYTLSY